MAIIVPRPQIARRAEKGLIGIAVQTNACVYQTSAKQTPDWAFLFWFRQPAETRVVKDCHTGFQIPYP